MSASMPSPPVAAERNPVIAAPAPRRVHRAQIVALSLLVVTGIINYVDRGTLAVANHNIATELGLSFGQMGLLLSAFAWSYAIAQLPAGGLVDRIGPRRFLAAGLIVWSFAQAAGGFVHSFSQFILARVILGIG
jgi:sugar phosphate permease